MKTPCNGPFGQSPTACRTTKAPRSHIPVASFAQVTPFSVSQACGKIRRIGFGICKRHCKGHGSPFSSFPVRFDFWNPNCNAVQGQGFKRDPPPHGSCPWSEKKSGRCWTSFGRYTPTSSGSRKEKTPHASPPCVPPACGKHRSCERRLKLSAPSDGTR